jgi:hypothetical protein
MKISILEDYHDTLRTLECYKNARGSRDQNLERPRPGSRCARRTIAGHRGLSADPRADRDPQAAATATAETQAYKQAQCLPAHRCQCLHRVGSHCFIEPARRHSVVYRRGTHMGN